MTEPKLFKSPHSDKEFVSTELLKSEPSFMFFIFNNNTDYGVVKLNLETAEQFAQEILSKIEEVRNGRG